MSNKFVRHSLLFVGCFVSILLLSCKSQGNKFVVGLHITDKSLDAVRLDIVIKSVSSSIVKVPIPEDFTLSNEGDPTGDFFAEVYEVKSDGTTTQVISQTDYFNDSRVNFKYIDLRKGDSIVYSYPLALRFSFQVNRKYKIRISTQPERFGSKERVSSEWVILD